MGGPSLKFCHFQKGYISGILQHLPSWDCFFLNLTWFQEPSTSLTVSQPYDFSLALVLATCPDARRLHSSVSRPLPLPTHCCRFLDAAFPILMDEIFISSLHSRLCIYTTYLYIAIIYTFGLEWGKGFSYIQSVILNWTSCYSPLRLGFIFCLSWSRVKLLTKELIEPMNTVSEMPKCLGKWTLQYNLPPPQKNHPEKIPKQMPEGFICVLFKKQRHSAML